MALRHDNTTILWGPCHLGPKVWAALLTLMVAAKCTSMKRGCTLVPSVLHLSFSWVSRLQKCKHLCLVFFQPPTEHIWQQHLGTPSPSSSSDSYTFICNLAFKLIFFFWISSLHWQLVSNLLIYLLSLHSKKIECQNNCFTWQCCKMRELFGRAVLRGTHSSEPY